MVSVNGIRVRQFASRAVFVLVLAGGLAPSGLQADCSHHVTSKTSRSAQGALADLELLRVAAVQSAGIAPINPFRNQSCSGFYCPAVQARRRQSRHPSDREANFGWKSPTSRHLALWRAMCSSPLRPGSIRGILRFPPDDLRPSATASHLLITLARCSVLAFAQDRCGPAPPLTLSMLPTESMPVGR